MNRFFTFLSISLLVFSISISAPLFCRAQTTRLLDIRAPETGSAERTYFYSASGDAEKLLTFRKQLVSLGAHQVNCFLPFVVVCELPSTVDFSEHLLNSDIVPLRETEIKSSVTTGFVCGPQWVKQCYQIADRILVEEGAVSSGIPSPESSFQNNFLIHSWESEFKPQNPLSISSPASDIKGIKQNSEFMLGDILVQVIYPESSGPGTSENWSDQAISKASSGITLALLYFQQMYSNASIHFVIRNVPRAVTVYEPINFQLGEQDIWITDVMNRLGYNGDMSEYLQLIGRFNNDWRIQWGTDWVFTAFVANSENDFDHRFGTQPVRDALGYSEIGGPYLIVPFPVGFLPGRMPLQQVFKHEVGHIFWANYEHETNLSSCDDYSGYLNVRNWNKTKKYGLFGAKEGCIRGYIPADCIMNVKDAYELFYEGLPCDYTAGMMGVIDENPRNGVPDVVDAAPEIVFETAPSETVFSSEFPLRFQAVSNGVPNRNPMINPTSRITYALPVKDVNFTINGVGPIQLLPEDGVSDEEIEDFFTELHTLIPGLTEINVVARNTMGATSESYKKSIYYVGLSYQHFSFELTNDGIGAEWHMMGETFDAKFDFHRIESEPAPYDSIIIADVPPYGPPKELFQTYRAFDKNVIPGRKYKYYVEGTFYIPYRGEVIPVTMRSKDFEVYASLYLAEKQLLSAPSPNPFQEQTWISINIPPTYKEAGTQSPMFDKQGGGASLAPSVLESVPTSVNVIIYNALGQRVKDLYHGSIRPTVLTIPWNGTNNNNERVPSGVYFMRAQAGPYSQVQKILLLR